MMGCRRWLFQVRGLEACGDWCGHRVVSIARIVIHLIGEEVIHLGVVEVVGLGLASPPFRLWSDDGSGRTGLWS